MEGLVRAGRREPQRLAPETWQHARVRILHVVGRSHRRGAELVALELAHELDLLGHQNTLIALGPAEDGGRDPALRPLLTGVALGPKAVLLAARGLRRVLRDEPVDVVIAHGGWAVQVVTLATPRRGPVVVWQRILSLAASEFRPSRIWWWHLIARRVDGVVALTAELEHETRRLRFRGPIWVIPNARRPERFIDLDRLSESEWLRAEIGVGPEVELIGFVGHLVVQKRPERAVEVLELLRGMGRDVHLVMAGGGLLAEEVEREVELRGLRSHVTMLGHRDDVERVFAGVDVVLITSDAEGIPGVAIEAHMAGCPVVSFPVGGVGEVVEHDITGVVLASHDTTAMADQLDALLSDPARLAGMGERARALTPTFSANTTARTYAEKIATLRPDLHA